MSEPERSFPLTPPAVPLIRASDQRAGYRKAINVDQCPDYSQKAGTAC